MPPATASARYSSRPIWLSWAPEVLYQAGQAKVLRLFLDAEAIFPDPALRQRFEARARENLQREYMRLQSNA
ncbi:MAG: hypothetical protein K2P95_08310 [Hyphomonadaceae bacterium]|nr:hypothetical protein [Hyphomonadaceae bacterium]